MISLDPSKVEDISSLWVSRQINCQLIRMKRGVPTLEAAESIHYLSPVMLDIKLKPNILFTNGSEVTAKDVMATFNYLRKKRSVLRNVFSWIDGMTLKGKYELLIKLKKPIPQLLTVISAPHYPIFEKDFISNVTKDPSLWKIPISCGDYEIEQSNTSFVKLNPIKGHGLPLKFTLVPDSQLLANDLDKFDIVSMRIIGHSESNLSKFDVVKVFDPFQYYFVLNTRVSPWNNRNARCAFFSRLKPDVIRDIYGDAAKPADDFLPSGTLGYVKNENYMGEISTQFKAVPLPDMKSICVSYIATSIEKDFRPAYLEMITKEYPTATSKVIKNYTDLNSEIGKDKCDGTFYAAKSNYLDAYEYFVTFGEKGPSATGFYDKSLAKEIQKSQDIDKSYLRAEAYHKIVNKIKYECLMYPLFTMPYDIVYLRKSLTAVGMGEGAVNEYSLVNIQSKNN